MIPNSFDYHRPESVQDAIALLIQYGEEARAIAGGHSLIPMMKLRMADVTHLVDLQAIAELKGIAISGNTVTIGATTTQQEVIASEELAQAAPIIREAALQIADPQVRYLGTVGGNVANGDPGNDMPGLMQCLDAVYVLTGPDGTREVAAREFYQAAYFTSRNDDELLVSIRFTAKGGGYAYEKQKRKIGDYATAAAAVLIERSGAVCTSASIAMTNLSDTPVYCAEAVDALVGSSLDAAAIAASVAAMQAAIDPQHDNRGPVEFKRHVAGIVLRRAIERAASRA
jgi:carbon-monoxide dehydrogenase medium subunit